ncbi:MAG: hypothetical protein U5K72_04905 [Balneolaceae bacterium]|nr:hypothetical protein [Balneolaceae bacterium]
MIDYSEGFKLSDEGEVLIIGQDDKGIFEAEIDTEDPENVDNKIKSAIKRFRHHQASIDERKNAVRELFDILEYFKI